MRLVQHACAAAAALSLLCAPVPAAVDSSALATATESSVEVPPEYAALREQAIALHHRAVEGDEDSAEQAAARFERYLKRFADDAEARAYLGSAYAMMARDASSVVNKTRYANRGLRHLDRALDAGAGNFTVRMIRANVNSSLPKMFERGGAALDDMLALDEIYRLTPFPRMAREMIRIYEELQRRAPDAGPWAERLDRARELSGER